MKKALSLLAASLFLCTMMILCASAAITGDGYVAWDFANADDVAEWVPSDTTTLVTSLTGTKLSGAENDLRINNTTTAVSLIDELSDYPYVVIRYRNVINGGGSQLQFYHWTSTTSGNNYLGSSLTAGEKDEVLTKVINAGTQASWAGKPSQLRIDPFRTTPERSVELIDVCLAKDESTYKQFLVDVAAKRLVNTVLQEFANEEFGIADIAEFVDSYYSNFYTKTFGYSVSITVPDKPFTSTAKKDGVKGFEAQHSDGTFGFDVTVTDAENAYKFEGTATVVTEKSSARPLVWDFSNKRDAAAWTFTASENFTSKTKFYGVEYSHEKGTLLDLYFKTDFTDRYNLEDYNYYVLTYTLPDNGTNINSTMTLYYGAPNETYTIKDTTKVGAGAQKIKVVPNKTDERWNGYQQFRLSPNRAANPSTITLHDVGFYKDEADYINYSVNNALTRLENYSISTDNVSIAKAEVENFADYYKTLFDPDVTLTVDTSDAVFVAPVNGSTADPDGTDGSYTFEATATCGDVSFTRTITIVISCAKKSIILNFDNPIMIDALDVTEGRADVSLVSAADAEAGDFAILGSSVAKIVKKPNETAGNRTELNIRLDLANGIYPEISDLSAYPYVVYSYKIPAVGGTYQIYYYTDGYTSGHAYQQFVSDHMDEGYTIGNWGFKTLNPTKSFNTTAGAASQNASVYDYSWNGKASRLRFDFGKSSYQYAADEDKGWTAVKGIEEGYTVYLDYVGLFTSEDEANAFKANPTLDTDITESELKIKYADVFEAAAELDNYAVSGKYESDEQAKAAIEQLMAEKNISSDKYYISIENVENTVDVSLATPDEFLTQVDYRIICADSINNGNYAFSELLTLYFHEHSNTFGMEDLGVQYRADGTPGLRYGVKVTYNDYVKEALKIEGAENVTFGVLVMPDTLASTTPLEPKHKNLIATDIENVYSLHTYEKAIVDVKAVNIFEETDEYFIYTAVITNIPENANMDLYFLPYVKYDYESKTVYHYPNHLGYTAYANYNDAAWDK